MGLIKAILCDFDGTLVNTDEANVSSYQKALQLHGLNIEKRDLISSIKGNHWSIFLPQVLGLDYTDQLGKDIASLKKELYPSFIDQISINPEVISLLNIFPSTKKVLVSNASKSSIKLILKHFKISSLFDEIISSEDVKNFKPNPESYLLAIKRLGLNPSECLAIEDSEIGILASTASKIPTLRYGK